MMMTCESETRLIRPWPGCICRRPQIRNDGSIPAALLRVVASQILSKNVVTPRADRHQTLVER